MPRERVIRHASEPGRWELALALPHPELRPYVREYVGGFENMQPPVCRRELPTDIAPVIINFEGVTRFFDSRHPSRWTDYGSFASGAWDTHVRVSAPGMYRCVQVNFTILGARLFIGHPLRDMTNRVVALEDALGPRAVELTTKLYEARTWEVRFQILDREIGARIFSTRAPSRAVQTVWRRLVETRGRAKIRSLGKEIGWSHKHLVERVREELGLPPKVLARVLRFGEAVEMLRSPAPASLAEVAHACGFYDQAHFCRDFREFAGVTPAELVRSRLPDAGGFAG